MNSLRGILLATGLCLGIPAARGAAEVSVALHQPYNLFASGEVVSLEASLRGFPAGKVEVTSVVTDYFQKQVWKNQESIEVSGQKSIPLPLEIGKLGNGYYELEVIAQTAGEPPTTVKSSFAVVSYVERSADEVRSGKFRFGMKIGGGPRKFDYTKAMETCSKLGMVWTRHKFDDVPPALAALPIRIIYKVEMYPPEAYDEKRYGPMDQFKFGKYGWQKATVPLEEPYKKWLKEEVAKLSPAHNIFEIWNEAWGKVSPEDFARVSQWTKDVIREQRPDAKVGPNLGTHFEYDSEFIAKGGMEGMDALFLHPYGHPERSLYRARLQGIREFYAKALGREVDLYVTEYGSTTKPEGGLTEAQHAQVNVRRSLNIYAEGIKGFMPHWMGQTEKDPTDLQHWYGHFRANSEPKPALIGMATAARLIDGTNYVGDLFFGQDVGAMLFENKGTYTLILWTNDKDIPVDIKAGANSLTMINIMGGETPLTSPNGSYHFDLTGDPIYLVGVSPELAKTATKSPGIDQWVDGIFVRGSRDAHAMKKAPVIDGKLAKGEWAGQTQLEMSNSKILSDDASGTGFVSWDKNYLYVAAEITDDHPAATAAPLPEEEDFRKRQHNAYSTRRTDGLDVYVGSQPKYQIPEFIHTHDMHLFFSPVPENGSPVAGVVNQGTGDITSIPGMKTAFTQTPTGWSVEVMIPLDQLREFPRTPGSRVAFEMRLADADPEIPKVKLVNPKGSDPKFYDDATHWSYLQLQN